VFAEFGVWDGIGRNVGYLVIGNIFGYLAGVCGANDVAIHEGT